MSAQITNTATAPSSPDLLQLRYRIANRWSEWRQYPSQSVFVAVAGLALVALALALSDPWWRWLLDPRAPWARSPVNAAPGVALALLLMAQAWRNRSRLLEQHRHDWLAALPIAPACRQHARHRRVLLHTLATMGLILALLGWARLRTGASTLLLLLAAGTILGGLGAALLPEWRWRARRSAARLARLPAVANKLRASGMALLGAALETPAGRLARSAPWAAGGFLLLPPSMQMLGILVVFVLISALAMIGNLITHWRTRYLHDQQWLAAQPLAPPRLLLAYLPRLGRECSLWLLLVGASLVAFGAPWPWALAVALLLGLVGADAVLCTYATRKRPARFPLLLALHGLVVVGALQTLPPLAPLAALACVWTAWRLGGRS